jgi:hypothetical protein
MVNQVTGGDSYPLMDVQQSSGDGTIFCLNLEVKGRFPIYDLTYHVENIKNFISIPEQRHDIIMPGNNGLMLLPVHGLAGDDEMHLRIHFRARHGNFFQDIELKKVSGKNRWAQKKYTRAMWYGEKLAMSNYELSDRDYPDD